MIYAGDNYRTNISSFQREFVWESEQIEKLFDFEPGIVIFSELIPFALGLGIIIGVIGSFSSVRKYLNV